MSGVALGTATVTATCEGQSGSAAVTVVTQQAGAWPNEPAGFRRVIDKSFATTNMDADDALNVVDWWHSSGSPMVVTDESGESASPPSAFRGRFASGRAQGGLWQNTALCSCGRNVYFGLTFKVSDNWENSSLAILKVVWFIAGNNYTILKADWNGVDNKPSIGYTTEHNVTQNIGGTSINRGQWYRIEGQFIHPSSGGTGTFRLWIDGQQVLNTTIGSIATAAVSEIDVQPYIGGVGTHTGPTMDVFYGHLIVSTP